MATSYSKWDHIGGDDENASSSTPKVVSKVDNPVEAKKRAEAAKAAGRAPNPLDDLFTLGKDASVAELMAKMKALPTSAKQQLLDKLGPDVMSKVASMKQQQSQPTEPPKARVEERNNDEKMRALIGSRLVVDGLKSKPELNGRRALATQWHAVKGRYAVRIDGLDEPLLLKPENLSSDGTSSSSPSIDTVD